MLATAAFASAQDKSADDFKNEGNDFVREEFRGSFRLLRAGLEVVGRLR